MLKQEQFTSLERKIERFSKILEQKPGDGLTVLALAEASFRRGLKLEALTAYQVVTNNQPVPEAHLAVAEIYSQQNMTSEAYGELRELFALDPTNVEARLLAQVLQEQAPAPDDVAAILNEPTSDEAFFEAKLRLQIQRTIHNRELQERTRNVTLEPGVVIHEYYVQEAKKKLIEVDEQLRTLEELKLFNATLKTIPRPTPISAEEPKAADAETGVIPVPDMEEGAISTPLDGADFEVAAESEIQDSTDAPEDVSEAPPEEMTGIDDGPVMVAGDAIGVDLGEIPVDMNSQELSAEDVEEEEPLTVAVDESQAEEANSLTDDLVTTEELSIPSAEEGQVAVPAGLGDELLSSAGTDVEVASFDPANLSDLPPVPGPPELPIDLDLAPPPIMDSPSEELDSDDGAVEPAVAPPDTSEALEPVPASEVEQPSNSFNLDFSIGADSPVAPDLPSPEDVPAPEPLPIQVTEDLGVIDVEPDLLVEEASEEFVQEDGPSVDVPDVTTPPEETPSPPEEAAPISIEPEAVAEVAPEQTSGASAADRQAFYESKAEELGKLTGTLARTRGVTSIFLVARDGSTIDSVVKDNITEERVGELVKESFEFLLAYANSPSYWVLECTGGIFVMQTLDEDHVLIAIGQAGANFGALRYTMDKTKTKFGTILKDVPR